MLFRTVLATTVLVVVIMTIMSNALSLNKPSAQPQPQTPTSFSQCTTRSDFLSTMGGSVFAAATLTAAAFGVAPPQPAYAKDVDPALKGTKKDPAFEACLSQCMYECTKPKGTEQKSRAECLPECKKSCATSKDQLMLGTPVKKQ